MRKKYILLIIVFSLFFVVGCCCKKKVNTNPTISDQSSQKTEKEYKINREYGEITGLVEVYKDEVYIVTKWTSRSRTSYYVEGKYKEEIAKYKDRIVTVKGYIFRHGWSGNIEVTEIVKVK